MAIRLKLLTFLFLLAFLTVIVRLFYWQVFKGKDLSIEARGQYKDGVVVKAGRGNILASDGTWLAASDEAWLVYVEPDKISENSRRISERLAPFFIEDVADRKQLLEEIDRLVDLIEREGSWVPLKQKVDRSVKESIEAMNISGIGFEKIESRVYPEGSSAAHLLGFVGKDERGENTGYFGLEGYYDIPLSGKPGFLARESDARGIPIFLGDSHEISAISGVDLLTHIDKTVQILIDKKLREGIEKYGAIEGSVIVLEPATGAILGMTAYPAYDPAKYFEWGDEYFKNSIVSSSFEPGSIFKVLVMAAAIDSGVVEPEERCDICDGPVKVDKYTIETWNNEYYPDSTMTDVIVHSDNVGMVYVAQKLGKGKFVDYLEDFGMGRLTNIDLQGESSPEMRKKGDWGIVELATASFGQGIAATPIQMIRAISTIANDGKIVTPQIVDKIQGGSWEEDVKPDIGKQVISKKAAEAVTMMMVEAAKKGEAKWTHQGGFRVAGKTGTAQIPIEGHYDEEKTIASFVGFAPYDEPKFIMLVSLREPSSSPWASETAAPLWYSIARDLFPYYGIHPDD